MQVFENPERVPAAPTGGRVATLGVFDGVHVGHAAILRETIRQAKAANGESLALTFQTHPRQRITGESPPSICSLAERIEQIGRIGVDIGLALPFDECVRETSAEEFLSILLRRQLGVNSLVLGHDARFGRGREGDTAFARARGWQVTVIEPVTAGGMRVSSGSVRAAIAEGRLDDARILLGREPVLRGTIVKGDGRGRTLGFATANLELDHVLRPPRGVYAAAVTLDGSERAAVVNIGVRPTFGESEEVVEAHIPGWSGDLYGRVLSLTLLTRLREEMRFGSADELKRQLANDVAASLSSFEAARPSA